MTNILFAQKQNNVWYFGKNAGLDFNSGAPVVLTNGKLSTSEGCSSISDNLGNLLFYTDGISVYNRNHTQMPNGFGLNGSPSTTQSALIIPVPSSNSQYYIFSIDDLGGSMKYSKVDMVLDGGLGDVVSSSKNILLHPAVSEKQVAIKRCDGNIWVISHDWGTNKFFADLVTPSGINTTIKSSVGFVHFGGGNPDFNSVGYMKASQQGDKLALAIRDAGFFEVVDFDVYTGIVSNPIDITCNAGTLYGVEFSPDGKILYGSSILSQQIFQYNLLAGSPSAISSSAVTFNTTNWACGLQLATNGKIYVAKPFDQTTSSIYLGVINFPNTLGASCNYVNNAVSLSPKGTLLGLPDFMVTPSNAISTLSISGNLNICSSQSTSITASGLLTYQWSGGGITDTTSTITVSPTTTTTYYLTGTNSCGNVSDSVIVKIDSLVKPQFMFDETQCGNEISFKNTSQGTGTTIFYWNFGDNSFSNEISPIHNFSLGNYNVTLISNPNTFCADSVQQIVNISNIKVQLIIPNIFTPNADGVNDEFKIGGLSPCKKNSLAIYNRWGEKIFETDSAETIFWNGINGSKKEIVDGVYFYTLTVSDDLNQSDNFNGIISVLK